MAALVNAVSDEGGSTLTGGRDSATKARPQPAAMSWLGRLAASGSSIVCVLGAGIRFLYLLVAGLARCAVMCCDRAPIRILCLCLGMLVTVR